MVVNWERGSRSPAGSVNPGYSNSVRDSPVCRMIDLKVPTCTSRWSGTGTVMVPLGAAFCMTTWLPRRRTSANP